MSVDKSNQNNDALPKTLGLIEDVTLVDDAKEVVSEEGSGVKNAQISGLLTAVRASLSYDVLRRMTQHQMAKARNDGDRSRLQAAFYDRLFKALKKVEQYAADFVKDSETSEEIDASKIKKVNKEKKKRLSGRLALTLMTHVAAEHQWSRRNK